MSADTRAAMGCFNRGFDIAVKDSGYQSIPFSREANIPGYCLKSIPAIITRRSAYLSAGDCASFSIIRRSMDNVTHTLFGLVLAKTGLERSTPKATLALLIGANLPDLDLLALLGGPISYLKYHCGISHSLPGLLCEAVLLAAILLVAHRVRSKVASPANFGMLFLMSLAGLGSHTLLDYTNTYGIRPFLPFDGRWFAADLVFIVDPWMLAILASGLLFPWLFRLISQEIGAKAGGYRGGAFVALTLITAFWASKWVAHEYALAELRQRSHKTGDPVRVGALPQFLNPAGWHGVIETEKAYHLSVAGFGLLQSEFARRRVKTLFKPEQNEIVAAATQGTQAKVFLDFARYPLFQISPIPEGYQVTVRDLRFDFASRFRQSFVYSVQLDHNLKVISEQFRF
ncbi:MAG: metal-dependent hydrolase [Acidobacteria bacterium]|nr:metal-dependent hydrolase [Acidobacteriota bacterium]